MNKRHKPAWRTTNVAGSLRRILAVLLSASVVCQAHGGYVHQTTADYAFLAMARVAKTPPADWPSVFPKPASATDEEWYLFLKDVGGAVGQYQGLRTGLSPHPHCLGIADTAGALEHAVPRDYMLSSEACWDVPRDSVPGLFGPDATSRHRDYTGTLLGLYSAAVDDETDDTHLWVRLIHTAAGPPLVALDGLLWALSLPVGIILIPFVCLFEAIFGGDHCASDAFDISTAPARALGTAIEGAGDLTSGDYVGLWHFLNVTPAAAGETRYDDVPGKHSMTSGPDGMPDAFEVAILAATDLGGISLNYDRSLGPHRYEILGSHDGSRDSTPRSSGQWQRHTMGHTIFSPLDNLALYGWARFRDAYRGGSGTYSLRDLGWPLHALGDAVVPMHITGTTGWGHRPFEDVAGEQLSQTLYYNTEMRGPDPVYDPATSRAQEAQVVRVLQGAWEWRQMVLRWRAGHPERVHDVNIREMVTALARRTYSYSMERMPTDHWPFNDTASFDYFLDKVEGDAHYRNETNLRNGRYLIEQSISAQIGFLVSAVN